MTPKREPRWTPKRPKNDIKIDIDFDTKSKRADHGSTFRLWVEKPPWEAPREPWGGGPSGTGPAPRHPCAR